MLSGIPYEILEKIIGMTTPFPFESVANVGEQTASRNWHDYPKSDREMILYLSHRKWLTQIRRTGNVWRAVVDETKFWDTVIPESDENLTGCGSGRCQCRSRREKAEHRLSSIPFDDYMKGYMITPLRGSYQSSGGTDLLNIYGPSILKEKDSSMERVLWPTPYGFICYDRQAADRQPNFCWQCCSRCESPPQKHKSTSVPLGDSLFFRREGHFLPDVLGLFCARCVEAQISDALMGISSLAFEDCNHYMDLRRRPLMTTRERAQVSSHVMSAVKDKSFLEQMKFCEILFELLHPVIDQIRHRLELAFPGQGSLSLEPEKILSLIIRTGMLSPHRRPESSSRRVWVSKSLLYVVLKELTQAYFVSVVLFTVQQIQSDTPWFLLISASDLIKAAARRSCPLNKRLLDGLVDCFPDPIAP